MGKISKSGRLCPGKGPEKLSSLKASLLLGLFCLLAAFSAQGKELYIRNQPLVSGIIFERNEILVLPEILEKSFEIVIEIDPSNQKVHINRQPAEVNARKIKGEFYLPLSGLAAHLGYRLDYDPETGIYDVYQIKAYTAPPPPSPATEPEVKKPSPPAEPEAKPEPQPEQMPQIKGGQVSPPGLLPPPLKDWDHSLYSVKEDAQDDFRKVIVCFYNPDGPQDPNYYQFISAYAAAPELEKYRERILHVALPLNSPEAKEYGVKEFTVLLLHPTGEIAARFSGKITTPQLKAVLEK